MSVSEGGHCEGTCLSVVLLMNLFQGFMQDHILPVTQCLVDTWISTVKRGFTRPNDGWAGLCIKLCSLVSQTDTDQN